jgi:hypothetical protein
VAVADEPVARLAGWLARAEERWWLQRERVGYVVVGCRTGRALVSVPLALHMVTMIKPASR